jgi:hypothetical protein
MRLVWWGIVALLLPYCRRYEAVQPCNGDIMVDYDIAAVMRLR